MRERKALAGSVSSVSSLNAMMVYFAAGRSGGDDKPCSKICLMASDRLAARRVKR